LDENTDAGHCNQKRKSHDKEFGRQRCDFTHHQTLVELSGPSSAVIPDTKERSAMVKSAPGEFVWRRNNFNVNTMLFRQFLYQLKI
jgi:hypothetical protein